MIRLSPSLQQMVTLSLAIALATLKTHTPTPMKKMGSTLAEDVHKHQVTELMLTIPMENTSRMDLSMEARAHLAPTANLNPPTKAGAIRASTVHHLATTLESRTIRASTMHPLAIQSRAIQASTVHPLAIQSRAIRASTAHLLTIQPRVIRASTALPLATTLETPLIDTILETPLIDTILETPLIDTTPKTHPFAIPSRDRRTSIARLLTPAAKEIKMAPKAYKLVNMAIHTLLTLAPEWRHSTLMTQQLDTTLFSVKELSSESTP